MELTDFKKKVMDIYGAIAALPEDNDLFHDKNAVSVWLEMAGGPYGGVSYSLGEARENAFNRIGMEWEDFKFTPSGFYETGDVITVEGNYEGVNRKTGKKINARVIHLWKLAEGKVLMEQFTDTALFWKAMEED